MKGRGLSNAVAGWLTAGLLAAGVTGCATPPPADDPDAVEAYRQANDPLEPFNRTMFEINLAADKVILKPIAYVYKNAVPDPFQTMIRNILDTLKSPIIFANDLLQGEWDRAGYTIVRLMMNAGFGIAGTVDIATAFGIPKHDEDFGQTLAVWGTGEGPYLVLPVLGPSNPRDAIGFLVDFLFDPFTYLDYRTFDYARYGADIVDNRARRYDAINELERTSLDFYAAVRSLYRQHRNDEIRNGAPPPTPPLPTISYLWGQAQGMQGPRNLRPLE